MPPNFVFWNQDRSIADRVPITLPPEFFAEYYVRHPTVPH
jgi:hypothetical protein